MVSIGLELDSSGLTGISRTGIGVVVDYCISRSGTGQ